MRLTGAGAGDEPEINLISLIDVIFCVIVFLVVTTTFDVTTALRLQLPTADAPPATATAAELTVDIDADGDFYLGAQKLIASDHATLMAALARIDGDPATRQVLLRADGRAPHQAVVTVMNALGQSGYSRIAIATLPEPAR